MVKRRTRRSHKQRGGLMLRDSNYSVPRVGYYEAGIFEGAGSEGINSDRWLYNPLSTDLTTIPGLGDSDAARLRRLGIETTINLIGLAMIMTGTERDSGVPLVFYLRKAGLRHPALVARMVIEKIDNMLLRPTDYANPIIPPEPNGVNYPNIPMPELTIADFAEARGIERRIASIIYEYATKYGLTLELASIIYDYATKYRMTFDKVYEMVQARSEHDGKPIANVISHLPREMDTFNRRKHALATFVAAREPVAAAPAAAAGAAAANAAAAIAATAATGANARRQTRRRRN